MWYLSRTPISPLTTTQSPKNNLDDMTQRNSIFPISETGIFQEISIVKFPNYDDDNNNTTNLWDWFAYISSSIQSHCVAVPRNPSFRIQVIAVLPLKFLCTKLTLGPNPYASLCTYSCCDNELLDMPKMNCGDLNLIGAAAAFLEGCLYLAGGYKGNPSDVEPSAYLNLAEQLNLKTWEWKALPDMQNPRAFATGVAHKSKFYVVGGNTTLKNSAEIYDPKSNSWKLLRSFVPEEADGYAVASLNARLLILTWSDRLGVKLWLWVELASPHLRGGLRLINYFPNQQIERHRIRQNGARMVRVGREIWVIVGENDRSYCQIDGMCAWPVFPAPMFRPASDAQRVMHKGHIYAFSFTNGVGIRWRQIPVYSI